MAGPPCLGGKGGRRWTKSLSFDYTPGLLPSQAENSEDFPQFFPGYLAIKEQVTVSFESDYKLSLSPDECIKEFPSISSNFTSCFA